MQHEDNSISIILILPIEDWCRPFGLHRIFHHIPNRHIRNVVIVVLLYPKDNIDQQYIYIHLKLTGCFLFTWAWIVLYCMYKIYVCPKISYLQTKNRSNLTLPMKKWKNHSQKQKKQKKPHLQLIDNFMGEFVKQKKKGVQDVITGKAKSWVLHLGPNARCCACYGASLMLSLFSMGK